MLVFVVTFYLLSITSMISCFYVPSTFLVIQGINFPALRAIQSTFSSVDEAIQYLHDYDTNCKLSKILPSTILHDIFPFNSLDRFDLAKSGKRGREIGSSYGI